MLNEQIKISIIIPTYNRAATIENTIDSFIAQSFYDWEMLVVDDHSTDNTKEVIESYTKQDPRIHYLLNERKKGAQGARNTGILHAKADWVCFFDSDDYAYPQFLSEMTNAISDQIEVVSCYIRLINVTTGAERIMPWAGDGYILPDLLLGNIYISHNTTLIRKNSILEIGLLDEDCLSLQEWDTHIRLSEFCRYRAVRNVLVDYYWGNEDSISIKRSKSINDQLYILHKHHEVWRKYAYLTWLRRLRRFYFDTDSNWRKKLLKIAPELLVLLPFVWMKRKMTNKR